MIKKIYLLALISCTVTITALVEQPIVIIIPSYNNEKWHFDNLDSILSQENYSNFRVIYIDDCSSDNTFKLVMNYLQVFDTDNRVTVINNKQRRGAMANIYDAIHLCRDNEIIMLVDGDDRLAHPHVLSYINKIYTTENVWLTYGQYKEWPSGSLGFNKPFPQDVIEKNSFRKSKDSLPVSHLRTFYAWLFKQIKKEDLMYKGDFFVMTWDKAIMAPMLEMAGYRHKFIKDVLYIYNNNNPLNDHQVNKKLQMELMHYILGMPAYARLNAQPM